MKKICLLAIGCLLVLASSCTVQQRREHCPTFGKAPVAVGAEQA